MKENLKKIDPEMPDDSPGDDIEDFNAENFNDTDEIEVKRGSKFAIVFKANAKDGNNYLLSN